MPGLICFNRRFAPKWQITIIALLAIAFLTYLGFWQLQRAHEKKEMLARDASFAKRAPLQWSEVLANPQQYQSITVKGRYLPVVLLLDNQHHLHQFGYHVLTPLQISTDKVILIDRGFIAGDSDRNKLPDVFFPPEPLKLKGQVYYPGANSMALGQVLEKKAANLAIVESIDTKIISQFLQKSVYPFIIRLHKAVPYGYLREWAVVSMPPERHNAYALQWFAMALVVLVLFISLNTKKIDENGET
jgi:surfeit locus 1 family protein